MNSSRRRYAWLLLYVPVFLIWFVLLEHFRGPDRPYWAKRDNYAGSGRKRRNQHHGYRTAIQSASCKSEDGRSAFDLTYRGRHNAVLV